MAATDVQHFRLDVDDAFAVYEETQSKEGVEEQKSFGSAATLRRRALRKRARVRLSELRADMNYMVDIVA